jgi:hypothetical protein
MKINWKESNVCVYQMAVLQLRHRRKRRGCLGVSWAPCEHELDTIATDVQREDEMGTYQRLSEAI